VAYVLAGLEAVTDVETRRERPGSSVRCQKLARPIAYMGAEPAFAEAGEAMPCLIPVPSFSCAKVFTRARWFSPSSQEPAAAPIWSFLVFTPSCSYVAVSSIRSHLTCSKLPRHDRNSISGNTERDRQAVAAIVRLDDNLGAVHTSGIFSVLYENG